MTQSEIKRASSATAAELNVVGPRLTWTHQLTRLSVLWVLVLGGALLVGAMTPGFMNYNNFQTIIRDASITGIAAVGLSFVTLTGNYLSLAVAESATVAAALYVSWTNNWSSPTLALLAVVVALALVGAIQGVAKVTILAFVICSAFVGFAATLQASQYGISVGTQFQGLTFAALTAVLVGGMPLAGGAGSPAHAALGACFVSLVSNVLLLRDYSYGVQTAVQGLLVLIAVLLFSVLSRRPR